MGEILKTNIKVEYENMPIKHIAIQCPKCKSWFKDTDILIENIHIIYKSEIVGSHCVCPKCGAKFNISDDSIIEDNVKFPDFYNKCLKRKVIWE